MDQTDTASAPTTLQQKFIEAGMNEIAARIMSAALRLFARRGYAATTVRAIVEEADVTNPMLYYYFDSKKGVFLALIEVLFESITAAIEEIVEEHDDLETRLREFGRAYFDSCRQVPESLQFIHSALFGPVESRPEFEIPDAHVRMRSLVEQTFDDAIQAGRFVPQQGATTEMLTERFLGLVNNQMMGALSVYAQGQGYMKRHQTIDDYLSGEALDEMLKFFFHGAGELGEERG